MREKVYDQFLVPALAYARVGMFVFGKKLLPVEYARRIAGNRLNQSEYEVRGRHEVEREHVKLNADPKHQRHAEYAAAHRARIPAPQQQPRRGKVGKPVHDKKRIAGKRKVRK
ncbi:MAG: hypothetical protein SOX90_04155 [Candidatus Fimadaptatus sp.]|nr:hypothetical protein [Candidatus Fimadaptatus sp.]